MDGNTAMTTDPSRLIQAVDSCKDEEQLNQKRVDKNNSLSEAERKAGDDKPKQRKVLETLVLYLAGISFAFSSCMIGPCLLDLQLLTNSDTATIAMMFTANGLGSLAGYIACGVIIDKLNHWLLVSAASVLGAVFVILTPLCRNITYLLLCSIPSGFMDGFLDASCFTLLMMIWGEDNGPWMQAYTFLFGIGCMISPLAVEPFLQTPEKLLLINTSALVDTQYQYLNYKSSIEHLINFTDGAILQKEGTEESKLLNAFAIPCILKLLTFVASTGTFLSESRKLVKVNKDEDSKSGTKNYNFSTTTWITFLILLSYLSALDGGLESCMGGYLMTFSVEYLEWTKFHGATVTFVFQGTYTFGCALGIFIITKLRPWVVLIIDLSLCTAFSVILAVFINLHDAVLWVCAAGIGLGLSTILATTFTWTERQVGVNARVSGVVLVGCGFGDMAFPAITGVLMDKVNLLAFVYVMLFLAASALVIMVILIRMTRKSK